MRAPCVVPGCPHMASKISAYCDKKHKCRHPTCPYRCDYDEYHCLSHQHLSTLCIISACGKPREPDSCYCAHHKCINCAEKAIANIQHKCAKCAATTCSFLYCCNDISDQRLQSCNAHLCFCYYSRIGKRPHMLSFTNKCMLQCSMYNCTKYKSRWSERYCKGHKCRERRCHRRAAGRTRRCKHHQSPTRDFVCKKRTYCKKLRRYGVVCSYHGGV